MNPGGAGERAREPERFRGSDGGGSGEVLPAGEVAPPAQPAERPSAAAPGTSASRTVPIAQLSPGAAKAGAVRPLERPRIWVLPTSGGHGWAVLAGATEQNIRNWASAPPVIHSAALDKQGADAVVTTARTAITRAGRSTVHEALYRLATRVGLGLFFTVLGFVGLRLPGVAKLAGELLFFGGLGFFGYSLLRHGAGWLSAQHTAVDAGNAFAKAEWQESELLNRIAKAIELRKHLDHTARGESPDAELLDAKAYRELIRQGVTTPAELVSLGEAVGAQLGMGGSEDKKSLSDVARDAGLDLESALVYADLAAAAREIGIEYRLDLPQ